MKKGEMPIMAETKPSLYLDKKEVPAVDNFDFGDKLTITISGKVISKNKDSICIEYGKGDCELSDEISKEADKHGLKRKDWKEITSKRKKEGDE